MSFDPVSYAMGTKAAGGGGGGTPEVMVCTFSKSGNTISCDKTGAEIVDAYNAGMEVIGLADYGWASGATMMSGDAVVRLTRVGYNSGTANMLTFTGAYFFPGDSVAPDKSGTFALTGLNLIATAWSWSAAYVPASSLPAVTSSDNGKVLGVSNGAWGAEDRSPLAVTYTIIGGEPPVYQLSYSHTLSQIAAAQAAGREVIANIIFAGFPVSIPAFIKTAAMVTYSGVSNTDVGWLSSQIVHISEDSVEYAVLRIDALNTTTMEYDSSTGTLYINNVPGVL